MTDPSTGAKPDPSASTPAPAGPPPGASPSEAAEREAPPPRDERPFVVATETEALARVRALPEAREAQLVGRAGGPFMRQRRDVWLVGRPEPGCVEGAPACRWHLASGTAGPEEFIDHDFYVDARSGALLMRVDEGWPERDVEAKPYAEWKAMRKREQRAWALVRALPEVRAVKSLGMQSHAPAPYECTASEATPCRFTFDVCDRLRMGPCEANMVDTLATFTVDEATRLVTVEEEGLTAGEPPVSVERWRELSRGMNAAKRVVEKRTCAGGRPSLVERSVSHVGCGPGGGPCAWALDMYFMAKGGVSYRNVMTVDMASHEIVVASRERGGGVGPSWPFAAFCERVARGEELSLAQWIR